MDRATPSRAEGPASRRRLGNANPGACLKPRVCGFDGLQTRVPGYPGLIMSVRRPVRVDGKPTVSGHLSETDLRSVGSCTLRGGRRLMEVGPKLRQYELQEHCAYIVCTCTLHILFSVLCPAPTSTVQLSLFKNEPNSSTLGLNRLTNCLY